MKSMRAWLPSSRRRETASGDALTALENEAAALTAERQQILNEMQARQRLRSNIAAGIVTGRTIEAPSAAEPTQARFTVDSAEYREAYLMHLQGRSLSAEQRAAVTATAAIPTQTLNRIVGVFDQNPILSRITMTYIPGNITIPVEGTVNSASWSPWARLPPIPLIRSTLSPLARTC